MRMVRVENGIPYQAKIIVRCFVSLDRAKHRSVVPLCGTDVKRSASLSGNGERPTSQKAPLRPQMN